MPTPPLDCGCPIAIEKAGYTIIRGSTRLVLCHHHGRAGEDAARRQGFTVIAHKVSA